MVCSLSERDVYLVVAVEPDLGRLVVEVVCDGDVVGAGLQHIVVQAQSRLRTHISVGVIRQSVCV